MKKRFQANLSLWLNCNLKCPYCWGAPLSPTRNWPAELAADLDSLRRFLNETGQWTLSMSGGEPTLYPGFGEFCGKLAQDGHRVEFYTNGTIPLAKVFPGDLIESVSHVQFSHHQPLEGHPRFAANFVANTRFLREKGIDFTIGYVLFPEREGTPAEVKERLLALGGDVSFKAFQGELNGKHYPRSYAPGYIEDFAQVGDIDAVFCLKNGNHTPTFKRCRAGNEFFYIALRTGGVHTCEQLTKDEVANFKSPTGSRDFQANVRREPTVCPSRRCYCRLTFEQEEFLKVHDRWDMKNYAAWEELSRPTPTARQHWFDLENGFVQAIDRQLRGARVFLWGGGLHTLHLLSLFAGHGFGGNVIQGIIDSNPLKHGRRVLGLPTISVDHFAEAEAGSCTDIIISSKAFEQEIHDTIREQFGARFNVIRLYNGSLDLPREFAADAVYF